MDLDFSGLTDDQLVALIRAACGEAVNRGSAVESAARDAYMSADERVQIARAAADREVERVRQEETDRIARDAAAKVRGEVDRKKIHAAADASRKIWAAKKGIALAAAALTDAAGYETKGIIVHVWLSAAKEKRVYIGFGFDNNLITYFVTGNKRNAPGSIEFGRKDADIKALRHEFAKLCLAIANAWNEVKVDVSEALAWDGDAVAIPGYVVADTPAPAPTVEVSPADVTLPPTIEHRNGVEGIRCTECSTWAHDGERLVHRRACISRAQVPDGYVTPQVTTRTT